MRPAEIIQNEPAGDFKKLITCVTHLCSPHHISLSCHCSSPQVHIECPILRGSEVVWITHEADSHFFVFLLSPLPSSLPQFSTCDRLTPKPCFIAAPPAADDTSFRLRDMQWVARYCWRTEGARIYDMISHPEAQRDSQSSMGSHEGQEMYLKTSRFSSSSGRM